MSENILLREQDEWIFEREIAPWLPAQLVDVHAHLIWNSYHPNIEALMPSALDPELGDVDLAMLEEWWRVLFPCRQVTGLVYGTPTPDCDWEEENAFVIENLEGSPHSMLLMTPPAFAPNALEDMVRKHRPAGIKPSLSFTSRKPRENAAILDIVPESHLDIANRYGLMVMLSVAKPFGMADPENIEHIVRLARAYPKCQFVLGHCGKCFITPDMEEALDKLPELENLWIDTSSVCDTGVFVALLSGFNRERIVYGSDLATPSGFRGTYVALGLGWHVCTEEMVWGGARRATFAAYENIRAIIRAGRFVKIKARDYERIFCDNGMKLLECGKM